LKVAQTTFDESLSLLCRYNSPRLRWRKEGATYFIEPHPNSPTVEVMTLKTSPSTASPAQKITPAKTFKGQPLDERRVSLDIQNAPLREVLTAYFDAFDVDFIMAPEVQGTVTMAGENLPFDQALRQLMRAASISVTYTREGRRFLVRTRLPVVVDSSVKK
jgi:type II secretory pathway component HofQ